jgi:hypothetical protein
MPPGRYHLPVQEDDEADVETTAGGVEPARSPGGASFGGALGAAMLGLEHALRRTPPAEVVVQEHQPARGASGEDGGITLVFPDPMEASPAAGGEPGTPRGRRRS